MIKQREVQGLWGMRGSHGMRGMSGMRWSACFVVCAIGCGSSSTSGSSGTAGTIGGVTGSGTGSTGSSGSASTGSSGSAATGSSGSAATGSSGSAATGTSGSSSGNAGNCQNVAPCGGDVTGTWKITRVCESSATDLSDAGCAGGMFVVTIIDYEGTITFGSGDYTTLLTSGAISETLTEPTACLGQNTSATSCDQLSTQLMQEDSGVTGSCSTTGANCICTAATTVAATTSTGTYTTSGTTITTTSTTSGTSPEPDGYCVQGNTLYLEPMAASQMTGTTVTSTLVLTKQ
jgi:hypothetical protein